MVKKVKELVSEETGKPFTIEYNEIPFTDERPEYTVQEIFDLVRPILEQFPCRSAYMTPGYSWYTNPEGLLFIYVDADLSEVENLVELGDIICEATNTLAWVSFAYDNIGGIRDDYIILYERDEEDERLQED